LDRAFYDSARLGVQDRLFARLLMLMGDAEVEESRPHWMCPPICSMQNSDTSIQILMHSSGPYQYHRLRSTSSLNEQIPAVALLEKGKKQFAQIMIDDKSHCIYSYGLLGRHVRRLSADF